MAFYLVDRSRAGSTSYFTIIPPSACPGYTYHRPVTISDADNATANSLREESSSIFRVSSTRDFEPQEALECPMDEQIKTRRSRSKFSTYQRRELEKVFSQSPFLSMQNCHLLMQRLGISEQIIKTWFRNRRAKWRKELRQTGTCTAHASTSVSNDAYRLCFDHVPYPSSTLMMRDARMLFGTTSTYVPDERGQYRSRPLTTVISIA